MTSPSPSPASDSSPAPNGDSPGPDAVPDTPPPSPKPRRWGPLLTAAGLAVALPAALVGVWQAGEWRLRVADAAHARGECGDSEAVAAYEGVEDLFQLSFSSSLTDRARAGAEACGLLERARADVAAGEYEQALASYGTYFEHPAARWEDTTALSELYGPGTGAYADEDWCTAFEQIGMFTDLPWELTPEVAERIDTEYPDAAFRCGWEGVDTGELGIAEDAVAVLESEYPDHEADEVARMATHIGAGRLGQKMDAMILHEDGELRIDPVGGSGSGGSVLEITNSTPYLMRLLYVGPDGAHGDITASACDGCEAHTSCYGHGEVMRVELEPGEYRMLLTWGGRGGGPFHNTFDIAAGTLYETCYYYSDED
ncbi:hypothetical protein [Nocardiopsis halotolerans]|uniref:hypothetical protein n=1 Tax=Nocardiopsis halotolerans TaxID=124252 RepID=UPI00034B592A|nr:hypothetical protein [Nocardiopsis halotolerans]